MKSILLGSFGLVIAFAQQAQSAVLVDSFLTADFQTASVAAPGVSATTGVSSEKIYGDASLGAFARSGSISLANSTVPAFASITLGGNNGLPSGNFETYAFDDFFKTPTQSAFTLEYTGIDNIDFLSKGAGIAFTNFTRTGSVEPLTLTLTVNNAASLTVSIPQQEDPLNGTTLGFSFSDFGANAILFASVTSLKFSSSLSLNTITIAADDLIIAESTEFNPLTPVPEPTSLVLACMGLIGFGGYARRKIKVHA